jgi:hypothetical protein
MSKQERKPDTFFLVGLIKETSTTPEDKRFARVFGPFPSRPRARYYGKKLIREAVKDGMYLTEAEAKARVTFKVADFFEVTP